MERLKEEYGKENGDSEEDKLEKFKELIRILYKEISVLKIIKTLDEKKLKELDDLSDTNYPEYKKYKDLKYPDDNKNFPIKNFLKDDLEKLLIELSSKSDEAVLEKLSASLGTTAANNSNNNLKKNSKKSKGELEKNQDQIKNDAKYRENPTIADKTKKTVLELYEAHLKFLEDKKQRK